MRKADGLEMEVTINLRLEENLPFLHITQLTALLPALETIAFVEL